MPDVSVWERDCLTLAAALTAALADPLRPAETRFEDLSATMWAEEPDPGAVPHAAIGLIYRYRILKRVEYRLFGIRRLAFRRWRAVAEFGLEEMWDHPRWTLDRGMWCAIHDTDAVDAAYGIVERFAADRLLPLGISVRKKDP
jgi:hypothetical protein